MSTNGRNDVMDIPVEIIQFHDPRIASTNVTNTHFVLLVLSGRGLLLVDKVLLDHLLLELFDDGVDAHPLLLSPFQPAQPLRVLGQVAALQLLQLSLQLSQLVLSGRLCEKYDPYMTTW